MRVAVITDVHANLPALQAAINAIQAYGYDAIFHTGDAIGIGPSPAECIELLLDTPRTYCLIGNHEDWLLRGLPADQQEWMNDSIVEHLQWTHDQIDPPLRSEVAKWPYDLTKEFNDVGAYFLHYALDTSGTNFLSVDEKPSFSELDAVLEGRRAGIVCFGHYHLPVDENGHRRYINPGSLGLYKMPSAYFSLIDFDKSNFTIQHCRAHYDDNELFELFENRSVPGRSLIYKAFYDGRFDGA